MRITTKQTREKSCSTVSTVSNRSWMDSQSGDVSSSELLTLIAGVAQRISSNCELVFHWSASYRSKLNSVQLCESEVSTRDLPFRCEHSSFYQAFSRDYVSLLKNLMNERSTLVNTRIYLWFPPLDRISWVCPVISISACVSVSVWHVSCPYPFVRYRLSHHPWVLSRENSAVISFCKGQSRTRFLT